MKIVVLGTRGFPNVQGGVEKHCENLYPQLVEKGCEVIVFGRKPYLQDRDSSQKTGTVTLTFKGVTIVPLSCPKNKFLEAFVHTFKGILAARKFNPDLIHIHAIGPGLFVPLARMLGFKVVMTYHGAEYKRAKWKGFPQLVLRLAEVFACKSANALIAVAKGDAEDVAKRFSRQVTVIPNGVVVRAQGHKQAGKSIGVSSLKFQVSEEQGIRTQEQQVVERYGLEKGKYVLSVGRFVPEKGFHDLIEAFERAQEHKSTSAQVGGWKLVIVGDADHEDAYSMQLKKKAQEFKGTIKQVSSCKFQVSETHVILTGFLSGKPLEELYSNAGLFVLPSYYEGLPIVLLEAMSYGLSCVVSDIPANREVELAEERYFKAGDVETLALKIKEFMDKPLSDEERAKQVDMIRQKYDWEKIAQKTLEVYVRVKK